MRGFAIPVLVLVAFGVRWGTNGPASVAQAPAGEPPICFVVMSNEVHDPVSSRDLRLLIRKEDATEPNFVALLQYFRARYPDAEHLRVSCETSLRFMLGNYLTQHDIDAMRGALEGRPVQYSPKVWEGDAQAVLEREGTTEQIRYKLEGGDLRDLKCVQVTPRDPSCAGCPSSQSELVGSPRWAAQRHAGGNGVPCYFLISNFELDGRRFIRLLLDAGDGSVENLLALLEHFTEEHSGPGPLVVKVLTSLDQERDPLGPSMKEHFAAVLFRDDWNQVIRYRHPGEDETTIVVRGADIFPDLDDARGHRRLSLDAVVRPAMRAPVILSPNWIAGGGKDKK